MFKFEGCKKVFKAHCSHKNLGSSVFVSARCYQCFHNLLLSKNSWKFMEQMKEARCHLRQLIGYCVGLSGEHKWGQRRRR